MMAVSSFDVVSKYDYQEVDNAVNQAAKEINQRYDFKNVGAWIELKGEVITMAANTSERVLAVWDVLQSKLIRRGLSLKQVDVGDGEPKPSGKEFRLVGVLKEGISQENAKKITKIIREEAPKSVKSQIQGSEVRVSSKSRDDLQATIALLKSAKLDIALQFVNYR
ncbi:MAG: YajQ family cyclic di-GMP-binding protein [Actinomycetaceae bacterium]|nr:YajQ family cyclic di-GMP-binding protein [Actinomycetaceae bacterium]